METLSGICCKTDENVNRDKSSETKMSSDFSEQINTLSKKRGFKMAFLNVVSLPKKIDEIKLTMSNKPLDIFALNETRLDSSIIDGMINIDGYDIVRKDRSRNGGGVCIFIRRTINYQIRQDLIPTGVEAVCIEINKPHSRPFVVLTVYRPPNAQLEFFDHLEQLLQIIDNENKELYFLGDLNCDLMKFNFDHSTKKLASLLEVYQLSQLINEPTRVTMTSSTLIDHFITNQPDKISSNGVIHTGLSDHSLIYAIRKINVSQKNKENIIEIRNMKHFNEDKFLQDLSQQTWDYVYFYGENPDSMWEIWKELFLEVFDRHAPTQHKKLKSKRVPWITSDIKKLINKRDKLKRKAQISKLECDWEAYKKARNATNTQLKQVKANYYSKRISVLKDDPKTAWRSVNDLLGKQNRQTRVNELDINGVKLNNDKDIAESFNKYFSNIGPNLAEKIDSSGNHFQTFLKESKSEFTAFEPITVNHVCQLLSNLSACKATGIDKISSKIIKMAAPIISSSLTYIFNQAITFCTFPNDWKIAKVIPLFKSGKRNLPGNYRPISVLPAISKVMERIIYNQIYEYFSTNNLLSEHQFGFRKYHSTATALLDCTNDWYVNMDRKLFNLVVFIDLKKAFDTIDHQILIEKLSFYGIKGQALSLIKSYLNERTQKCEINGHTSAESRIKCGVPQGSILGPLLFLIYINDLSSCLKQTKSRLFADDTNITAAGESIKVIEIAVNSDLENLRKWLIANKLSLNVAKTEFILIGTKPMLNKIGDYQLQITIENKPIKQISQYKALGVIVDENLSWKINTENICKKVSSGLYALKQIKEFTDQNTLKCLYSALIQPYFNYCCEIWDVFGATQSKRLQKLHNRAARIITSMPNETDQETVLAALAWEPLQAQRFKAKAKIMFKVLNNMGPNCLSELFTYKNETIHYNLRESQNSISLPKPRTNCMKKSFMFDGAKLWNSLPNDLRNSKTKSSFNRKLATHKI